MPPPEAGGMVPPDPTAGELAPGATPRAGPRGASLSLASLAQRERFIAEQEAGAGSLNGLDPEVVAELLALRDGEGLSVHLDLNDLLDRKAHV